MAKENQLLGIRVRRKTYFSLNTFFASWGFCNMCPIYSNNNKKAYLNKTWQRFPFLSLFSPCSLALTLTRRPWKSKAAVTRQLWLFLHKAQWSLVSSFPPFCPALLLLRGSSHSGFSVPPSPQDLCTRCSFHLKLSPPSVTHSYSSFPSSFNAYPQILPWSSPWALSYTLLILGTSMCILL